MEREKILVLAQLLASLKEAVNRLESAYKSQDAEHLAEVKREILTLQESLEGML